MNRKAIDIGGEVDSISPLLDVSKEGVEYLKEINSTIYKLYDVSSKNDTPSQDKKSEFGSIGDLINKISASFSPKSSHTQDSTPVTPQSSQTSSNQQSKSLLGPAFTGGGSEKGKSGGGGGGDLMGMAAKMAKTMMAEGGGTTAKEFIVGELGGKNSTELILNPTGAPLHVLNNEQQKEMGLPDIPDLHKGDMSGKAGSDTQTTHKVKGFAEGTEYSANLDLLSDILKNQNKYATNISNSITADSNKVKGFAEGTLGDIFKDTPRFPTGTAMADEFGSQVFTGGSGADPSTLISAPLDMMSAVANLIPMVGPAISEAIQAFKDIALVIVTVTNQFNQFAESLAYVSAPISQAKAGLEVKKIEQDIGLEGKFGERLAEVYTLSGESWLEIQKILAGMSEPFLDVLIPMLRVFKDVVDSVSYFMSGAGDLVTGSNAIIGSLLALNGPIGWLTLAFRVWRGMKQEEDNSKSNLREDMFINMGKTLGNIPSARTLPSGIGV